MWEAKKQQVQSSINENISHLLGHNSDGIIPRTSQLPCEMYKDIDEMLNTLTQNQNIIQKTINTTINVSSFKLDY